MQATLERLRQRREEEGHEGGFTLIELLIVIVILAILAAIVVFAVQNLSSQSAKAACQADYKTVQTAAETYKAQLGDYPGGAGVIATAAVDGAAATAPASVTTPSAGIIALMETWEVGGAPPVLGAWLKDYPANPTHYSISLSATGVVQVMNAAGTATIPATGTGTDADCSSVS